MDTFRIACAIPVLSLAAVLATGVAAGEESRTAAAGPEVGIVEKLGATVPLDVTFHDSERQDVRLGDVITKPTILVLVYLRCPSICSPLMNEVATMVDKVDGLVPGEDYDLLTVSFDPREDLPENAQLARNGKKALLGRLEKTIPAQSWRFLTGSEENIRRLTDAVGFYYKQDDTGEYSHAATTIFLSPEGKIVRYLQGLPLLPANVKLALIDAKEGRTRSIMQRFQRFCFSYDPEGKTYVLQINRIVLAGTGFLVLVFLILLLRRRKRSTPLKESNA